MRRIPTALLSMILTGCAVGPNYHRPATDVGAAFGSTGEWTPANPSEIPADAHWWTIYHDPVLDQLEQQVEVSNQTLRAAEANFRAAQAAVGIDRGTLLPTLSASGSALRSGEGSSAFATQGSTGRSGNSRTTSTTGWNYSAGLQGSWQLDVWGRIRRTVESDVAKAQASAADVAGARLSAQVALAQDYFQMRAAEEQLRQYKDYIAALQGALTITQNRVKAGVTTLADVYAAQTQLENTQSQSVGVELTRAKYEHAIAVLVGKPPSALSVATGTLAESIPVVPPGLPSQLLQRRPDVSAAERSVASANALIGVAESGWFPSLTLGGSVSYSGSVLSKLISSSNALWSVGPSLAETVFNGGATYFQTKQARANYDASVANYRETVLTALQQVEDDLTSLRVLEEQHKVQKLAVGDARHSEELILNQYKSGIVAYDSVITAQTTRIASEISLISLNSQQLVSSADLIAQLGGGWDAGQLQRADRGVQPAAR